ncbi:MAG: DUF2809 domain-containing protein [Bacteroidales bacterium]|nr:DUF2809 domain-containing protein [Bacteroidales bacterium]
MPEKRALIKTIVLIVIITALGFSAKLVPHGEATWLSNQLAGLFYVTELSLILYLFFPEHFIILLVIAAFLLTSLVEFMQLWHPAFLEPIRSSFLGHTIIGSTFSWLDFPWYVGGAVLGWLLLKWIKKT